MRESEERAEGRVKAIHEAYEKAAEEQQRQIKQLLREANTRAQQQQEYAVNIAVAEALQAADEDKLVALQHARAGLQDSALQQQEQLDTVLAEMAELRAENLRLGSDLQLLQGSQGGKADEAATTALLQQLNKALAGEVSAPPSERASPEPGATGGAAAATPTPAAKDGAAPPSDAAKASAARRGLDLDWN